MKIANSGRTVSVEQRLKISKALSGRTHSAEHRAKVSAAKKGILNPTYGKTWCQVDGKRIFTNVRPNYAFDR